MAYGFNQELYAVKMSLVHDRVVRKEKRITFGGKQKWVALKHVVVCCVSSCAQPSVTTKVFEQTQSLLFNGSCQNCSWFRARKLGH